MVILAASMKIKEEFMTPFRRAAYAMLPISRAEPECVHYHFYIDPHDDNGYLWFEKWASREALEAHFQTSHFKSFMEIIENMLREPTVVETFDVVLPGAPTA
ncbi:MAG TPA: putative quinol monooxygenase [Fimbriimonadaceae bacterium]|nr:putative quinol monooxygenase [Fimbriimonadaceae bacterium]